MLIKTEAVVKLNFIFILVKSECGIMSFIFSPVLMNQEKILCVIRLCNQMSLG